MLDGKKPIIGIGACLVGQPVRYTGESKKRNRYIESLKSVAELNHFCPEIAIGLGVPRKTIRIVQDQHDVRLTDSDSQSADYTLAMRDYAKQVMQSNPDMAGYVLVKGSPSCGFERVKRYNDAGHVIHNDARGVFTQALMDIDPLLPLEEDGRLNDHILRENFILRVYAYQQWKQLCADDGGLHELNQFWAQYKYQVMAHHILSYKELGRLLAQGKKQPLEQLRTEFGTLFMQALGHRPNVKSYTNVMYHIQGYLKRQISSSQKQELNTVINQYKSGIVPLIVPMTMLRYFFKQHDNPYINQQIFMQPYPDELGLRNNI